MSILVHNNAVLLSGNITEDSNYFRTEDKQVHKGSFPGATVVEATPPHEGRWEYSQGVFVSLDDRDAELAAINRSVSDSSAASQSVLIRSERNSKLSASDWTQVADAPVDQAAWAAYRQALRDITGQAGFPWTIDWPEQPV